MRLSIRERLGRLTEPEPNTGCWLWVGVVNGDGYGRLTAVDAKRACNKAAGRAYYLKYGTTKKADRS